MSRNRFQDLQRYFHLRDNSTQPPRGDPNYDRLNKVRPVIDIARANFRERYQPGQHQTVDEGMVKYKGTILRQTLHASEASQARIQDLCKPSTQSRTSDGLISLHCDSTCTND
ncbi:uncharacterized protein [Argopecten irradians]|uniref:uncharacterized protein n=1 Tax=Argopecten irradians TaxID=31199 RepID=UPI0037240B97